MSEVDYDAMSAKKWKWNEEDFVGIQYSFHKAIGEFNSDALWELCSDCETEEHRYEILMKVRDDKKISNLEYEWFEEEWTNNMNTFLDLEEEAYLLVIFYDLVHKICSLVIFLDNITVIYPQPTN